MAPTRSNTSLSRRASAVAAADGAAQHYNDQGLAYDGHHMSAVNQCQALVLCSTHLNQALHDRCFRRQVHQLPQMYREYPITPSKAQNNRSFTCGNKCYTHLSIKETKTGIARCSSAELVNTGFVNHLWFLLLLLLYYLLQGPCRLSPLDSPAAPATTRAHKTDHHHETHKHQAAYNAIKTTY